MQTKAGQRRALTSAIEFREALKKGTGRATMLLQKDPHDADLNAELLRACVENLVYDPQCEESRIPYLCELIRITGRKDRYRAALKGYLRAATHADPIRNVEQVFGILSRLAKRGGDEAFLLDFVLTTEDRAWALAGAPDLVRLQGLDALLACARRFGPEIAEEPWLIVEMARVLEERDGGPAAKSVLREARQADAVFDRLMRLADDGTKGAREPAVVPGYTALRAEVGARRHFPRAWIMGASQEDIERAAEDLLAETDDARVLAYLAVFRPRSFPGDPTRLFPLLASANKRVAHSAAGVLARVSHPAIRSHAHRLIAEGRHDLGVRLLRSSHGEGDLALFKMLLDRHASDEDAFHNIGFWALKMIEHLAEKPEEARAVLLHVYENELCSTYRWTAVDQLAAMGETPDWLAAEGRYDAASAIAERFRPEMPRDR